MIRFFFILTMLVTCIAQTVSAEERHTLSTAQFSQIPVLHEGRVKPLSSFARIELKKLSGNAMPIDSNFWLATTLFDPQRATSLRIIRIRSIELQAMLGLDTDRKGKLYSLEEIAPSLAETEQTLIDLLLKDEKDLTQEQKSFIDLHQNVLIYSGLLKALTPLLPLSINIPAEYSADLAEDNLTWLALVKIEPELKERVKKIIDAKGEDLERYSDEEKELARFAFQLQMFRQNIAADNIFKIIPPQWQNESDWLSPLALIETGKGSPQTAAYLTLWQDMASAWRQNDQGAWNAAIKQAHDAALSMTRNTTLSTRLSLEKIYNTASPFSLATVLYALALIAALFFLISKKTLFYKVGTTLFFAATFGQLSGIILRVFILERPPVGSLYESLLFVALIIAAIAAIIELKRKDAFALTGACAAALIIMLIAPLIAPNGDDLEMLVAVLNTSFWLATHVICITAGYGLCILTAVMAHIYLFRFREKQDGLKKTIYVLSLVSLFLTAFGTVLGGIWADQSWGRFWGWDPKENGALLIVLWLIWLHHGKMGAHLDSKAFHAGLAFLTVIVALAWFGVNLLSTGLHSYGFINGVAYGLGAFCLAESAIISALWHRATKKVKAGTHAA